MYLAGCWSASQVHGYSWWACTEVVWSGMCLLVVVCFVVLTLLHHEHEE